MVANTIESCYSRIKTLWKDVKPITSNTKHGNNSTKIGSQEKEVFRVLENEFSAVNPASGLKQIWEIVQSSIEEKYCN